MVKGAAACFTLSLSAEKLSPSFRISFKLLQCAHANP